MDIKLLNIEIIKEYFKIKDNSCFIQDYLFDLSF